MTVRLVNDGTALLSMRDSDFDAYSALGEVIDNSIQAGAKNVRIKMNYITEAGGRRKKGYAVVEDILFGDDGSGMDPGDVRGAGFDNRFPAYCGRRL